MNTPKTVILMLTYCLIFYIHVKDEIIKMLSVTNINQYFNFFMFRINSVVYTCSLVLNFTRRFFVQVQGNYFSVSGQAITFRLTN